MITIKILTYVSDLNTNNRAGGCKFCLTAVKQYSRHNITLCGIDSIENIDLDAYDIIHTHQIHNKFLEPFKTKLLFGMHGYGLNCPTGGYHCYVFNKLLDEPLTCLNCLGYVGVKTGGENLKKVIKMSQKSDAITVDCEYMQNFYHNYNPIVMPLPMETDEMTPCLEKENYIVYTGRLSTEKNPYGFLRIANKVNTKCKMIIYETEDNINSVKSHYEDIFKHNINNLEIIVNPTKEEMIDVVRHAKFTVLPYLFAEPFGVAAVNSVLSGTPLITFPYGNLRYMTNLLPATLSEMIKLIHMDDKTYSHIMIDTLHKSEYLRNIHNPLNAIKVWDGVYENVV